MEEIEESDPDSTDIFKRNMLDRYINRWNSKYNNGTYENVYNICLAIFVAHYYFIMKTKTLKIVSQMSKVK